MNPTEVAIFQRKGFHIFSDYDSLGWNRYQHILFFVSFWGPKQLPKICERLVEPSIDATLLNLVQELGTRKPFFRILIFIFFYF